MGRPRHPLKPPPAGPSRRDFFKRSGAATAVLASAPLLSEAATSPFQHGVASGDPLTDRVIVWTRITPKTLGSSEAVAWVIAQDPAMQKIVASGRVKTGPERDYTVKVDVTGLTPGRVYYYHFSYKSRLSATGRTRTLPSGSPERLRLAVASCSNIAAGYFNAYRLIAERADLDAVLHLGDYLYEYGSGEFGDVRPCEPATELLSLADYRMRHAQHKRDPDSQEMHRQHPLIAIWDDHETANDAWRDGAQNHDPANEGAWADRVAGALQAYYEWMPVRQPDRNNPRSEQRQFSFGDLADLFMLEERLGARSQQLAPNGFAAEAVQPIAGLTFTQTGEFLDPSRSLLGDSQEAWLLNKLRKSPARWKLLGQGVMFAQLKALGQPNAQGGGQFLNPDQWDGYQPARDRIYAAIQGLDGKRPINNLVVLTGDIHSSWAADLTPDPNNPDTASGGYNPRTGAGSLAVEFVGTSVTSPGLSDPSGSLTQLLMAQNPHFKYVELSRRGYMVVDITPSRVVGEWWHLDTVNTPSRQQSLAAVYQVRHNQAALELGSATVPPSNPPAPAP